jgi:hypothetical protein
MLFWNLNKDSSPSKDYPFQNPARIISLIVINYEFVKSGGKTSSACF